MAGLIEYRAEVLTRLDLLSWLEKQGIVFKGQGGPRERMFACPFHDDHEASANANGEKGVWFCHVCDVGGSAIDFLMKKGLDYKDALDELGSFVGLERPGQRPMNGHTDEPPTRTGSPITKMTDANVTAWHEAALRNKSLMLWFTEHRGYTAETLARFELGWDGQRVTIPVRDEAGKLRNVRRYMRDAKGEQGKMIGITPGLNGARLFPLPLVDGDLIVVEGEWDAMLMAQYGYTNAVTVTSGAGIWDPAFTPLFADRGVTIVYDNDDAGARGSAKVARILTTADPPARRVAILQIPNLPPKGDVTDFFVEQQRTRAELDQLIADATPYAASPDLADDEEPTRVPLHQASRADWRGRRLALPVLMSGKAMTPYTVPFKFTVKCDMGNKRYCSVCPLLESNGRKEVTLTARDPAVLSLIDVSGETQGKALRALAGAVPQCTRPLVEVAESINIEELRLIPELDAAANSGGDTEYVARQGFFLGHGLMPNRGYTMHGYSHPHPKSQATVHLLSEAIPAQDNISAFALDDPLREQLLATFSTADVETRWRSIYNDFASTVHQIRGRLDMQIAYDLVWHSIVAFTFNGAFVRRGWVEAMVMGDSGQGKTEMAEHLLRHYRLGERIQGEMTSMAGLIGGLEKMGDTWLLSWGRIPLNDKRLLIIDETQGLAPAAIEGMSDVRATGVAEITKIRTERTNARCRIVWLANPVSGLTLSQHNQGVLSIRDLFKKPEDIRRLDFAITVASGDVDASTTINIRHDAATEPVYSTELSRALILWAWSRRPDQVEFTPEATDAILAAATSMGRRYHPAIPLVEPSDQRLKLARLAVAAAARVYSADPSGERVVVRPEHVAFVVAFLDRIYTARSMAYGEFSEQQRRGESLTDAEATEVRGIIEAWDNRDGAIEFLRGARVFKKADLIDILGWDDLDAKKAIRDMSSRRLIRTGRDGFVKQPAFIALLRGLGTFEVPAEDPDEPF